jgi:long-chain fatty acid transport protein
MNTRFAIAIIISVALSSATARGAGFGLNEHGADAMGMAGAVTALANRPSTIFFNPAGIGDLRGLQIDVGLTMVTPGAFYKGIAPGTSTEVSVDAVRSYFWLPNVHATYRIHKHIAAGFGMYVPYGLTMEWPDSVSVDGKSTGWWGRGVVRKISLETIYFNPTAAVMIHPRIFVGGGVTIAKAAVGLNRAVAFSSDPTQDVNIELSAGDVAVGGTAGVLVKVIPEMLNAGFTFRSGVKFSFDGNAVFTKNGKGSDVPAPLRSQLVDSPANAALNLPHVFSFGVAAFPSTKLTLGFVADVITWSSYDKLAVIFKDVNDPTKINTSLSTSEPRNWVNTVCIRLGAEYRILDELPVRIGFIYDQGPPPPSTVGPELPDGDRYEFSIGGGYVYKSFKVDVAYQFLTTGTIVPSASAPLQGSYVSNAHLVGLTLGYALDI